MFCKALALRRNIDEALEKLPELGLLEYFWDEIYQNLSTSERALLKRASVLRRPFPARAVSNIPSVKNVWSIVHSPKRKLLLEQFDDKYFAPEVIRKLCYHLMDNPEKMHQLAAEYYMSEESTEAFLEAVYHMIKARAFHKAVWSLRGDLRSKKWNCIEKGYPSQYLDLLESIPLESIDKEHPYMLN